MTPPIAFPWLSPKVVSRNNSPNVFPAMLVQKKGSGQYEKGKNLNCSDRSA